MLTQDSKQPSEPPLTRLHARSFNAKSYGIEVLGDYDHEAPSTGRGLNCWTIAAETVAIMCQEMGIEPNSQTIKFHRDDPKTSKTCPGTKVKKQWFLEMVLSYYGTADENETTSNDLGLVMISRLKEENEKLKYQIEYLLTSLEQNNLLLNKMKSLLLDNRLEKYRKI